MPGLTQEDVTPVIPEQGEGNGQQEQEEQGYQWGRWLTNPGNEIKWLWNKSGETVEQLNRNVTPQGRVGLLKVYTANDKPDQLQFGATPAQREPVQGAVEATADVGLAATNLVQNVVEGGRATLEGREAQPRKQCSDMPFSASS